MRTFKSILLAGSMLLAIPAFFSSCKENAPELDYEMKVTVVNDFTDVVDAINQSNVSKEQAIKNIAAAIDNMKGDQNDKLQAIIAALNSTNTTLEKQLNVIAGAMQSMSIDLPAKVELIKTAVEGRPNYNEKLEAVRAAFQNINPNSQLETLNALLDKYGENFTNKLAAISGWFMEIGNGNGSLDQIRKAIESLGGYGGKLDAINTQMTALLQALESGNMSDKEAMAEVAKKIKELELNAGVGIPKDTMEYVDLGLPSGIKWAKCDLGETSPEKYGDGYGWGETWTKTSWEYYYYFTDIVKGQFTKYDSRDKRYFLEKEDDVAYLRLGEGWRYPTWNEVQELYDNCTVTESTLNGWPGVMFISKNNNNYIFFGYWKKSSRGSRRWSSALVPSDPSLAKCMYFIKEGDRIVLKQDNVGRDEGLLPVRPVYVKRAAKE
ncbi:hypothetical protein [Prevotella sp.]|uniref:hypothetical protein n=1 Tax=Prevotella sp. TaxID=59823 RepID=UPI0025DD90D7|nr:hypothetical protein [Prevotella sp.]MCI7371652.1 hypothetical protein [Prevotella sp.]